MRTYFSWCIGKNLSISWLPEKEKCSFQPAKLSTSPIIMKKPRHKLRQQGIQFGFPLIGRNNLKTGRHFLKSQTELIPTHLFRKLVAKIKDRLFVYRVITSQEMFAFCFDNKYLVNFFLILTLGKNKIGINLVSAPALNMVILSWDITVPKKEKLLLIQIPRDMCFLLVKIFGRNDIE